MNADFLRVVSVPIFDKIASAVVAISEGLAPACLLSQLL